MRDSHCALMANIFVSLDRVVKTMLDTGRDMQDKYKETARWPGSKRDRMLSDRCKRGLQT
jgi:ABC-type sulfate transport system permease component